jgi:hypothetical protein
MFSIVDTWGFIQHFFKSCLAIVTIGFCSVSLTRMHWHPVPQKIKQSYTKNYDTLVYNINQARQSFSRRGFVPNRLMTACLIATDDVYMLLPIWSQTLFRNGDCPYGFFLSPCPFRHGDSLYGYGDRCFCLPLSHGCAGAPPKILAKKPKFPVQSEW